MSKKFLSVAIIVIGFAAMLGVVNAQGSSSTSSGLVATDPVRLLDTREGANIPVGAQETIELTVTGANGVPVDATAVQVNVTVTAGTESSFLTLFPEGAPPNASNLNWEPGQTLPNLATVRIGADGKIRIFNNAGSVHVIVDLAGYYVAIPTTAPGAGSTYSLTLTDGVQTNASEGVTLTTEGGSVFDFDFPIDVRSCNIATSVGQPGSFAVVSRDGATPNRVSVSIVDGRGGTTSSPDMGMVIHCP